MLVEVPSGYRAGGWKVGERIASGSWASVYAARRVDRPRTERDPPRDTIAALKFIARGTLSPPQYAGLRQAISEEVRFSEQADHPRLIRTLETFVVDDPGEPRVDGAVVLAMERAARSVRDVLAGVTQPEAARVIREICEAIAHMHAAGWVHGDLKPGNVLLMADGSVRLADFGLARELDGTHAYAPRVGSPDYLPPEWWSERVSEQGIAVRTTTDIWALGVTAHQLLTGGLFPFAGATPRARGGAAQAYASGSTELRLADRLPVAWRPIVADCLAPDHASRLQHSAQSLLERIGGLPDADEAAVVDGGRPRRRWFAAAAAVLALGAAGTGAIVGAQGGAPVARGGVVTVFNAEARCRHSLQPDCRLGLAGDPHANYAPANIVGHARHGDRLVATCWIADGRPVMSEDRKTSRRWYRVSTTGTATAWLPAVRAWPGVTPKVGPCST